MTDGEKLAHACELLTSWGAVEAAVLVKNPSMREPWSVKVTDHQGTHHRGVGQTWVDAVLDCEVRMARRKAEGW